MSAHERLRRWLKATGLNQLEAAALIGIHPTDFNKVLHGKRRPGRDNAVKIQQVTGIPVAAWVPIHVDVGESATGTDAAK